VFRLPRAWNLYNRSIVADAGAHSNERIKRMFCSTKHQDEQDCGESFSYVHELVVVTDILLNMQPNHALFVMQVPSFFVWIPAERWRMSSQAFASQNSNAS
jgi:hypothetical protein